MKNKVTSYIIVGLLSISLFIAILYILGIRFNFNKDISNKNMINADTYLNIKNDEIIFSESEKEGINIYEKNVESVVNITTISMRYNIFFEVVPSEGMGSGSIITDDGHILTNYHVIKNVYESQSGGSITIVLNDQSKHSAEVVGVDPSTDLAVLKINVDKKLKPIEIALSDNLKVGQRVYAIGNPFGLSGTLTKGLISSLGRTIQAQDNTLIEGVIQTDAAINPGNSGGPLLDTQGRMIGVNTAIFTQTQGNIGIGFAVSSNIVAKVVDDILKYGIVKRPDLGIEKYFPLSAYPEAVFNYLEYPINQGVGVLEVKKGSPADRFGIRPHQDIIRLRGHWFITYDVPIDGDIIYEIDGNKIKNYSDIKNITKNKNFGDIIEIKILRNKKLETIKVELFEF